MLKGIKAKPEYNGRVCTILRKRDDGKDGWWIKMDEDGSEHKIREQNMDVYAASASPAAASADPTASSSADVMDMELPPDDAPMAEREHASGVMDLELPEEDQHDEVT